MIVCRVVIQQDSIAMVDTNVEAMDLAGVRAWCAAADIHGPARIWILQYTHVVESYILCYAA